MTNLIEESWKEIANSIKSKISPKRKKHESTSYCDVKLLFKKKEKYTISKSMDLINEAVKLYRSNYKIKESSLKSDKSFLFYEVIPSFLLARSLKKTLEIDKINFCSLQNDLSDFDAIFYLYDEEQIAIQCVRAIDEEDAHNESKRQELLEANGMAPGSLQKIEFSGTNSKGDLNIHNNLPKYIVIDPTSLREAHQFYLNNLIKAFNNKNNNPKGDWLIITLDIKYEHRKMCESLYKEVCMSFIKEISDGKQKNFKKVFIISEFICENWSNKLIRDSSDKIYAIDLSHKHSF